MAQKPKTMKVKAIKSFMYQQKEVKPSDTKTEGIEMPIDDARYFITCELAEEWKEPEKKVSKTEKTGAQ